MSTGTVYALGTSTPSGWTPTQIIYYQLSCNMDGGFQFAFMEDSGVWDSGDIDTFIDDLLANTLPELTPLGYTENPPNLRITVPCYIVIELDSSVNWRYQPAAAGIKLASNLSSKYFNLVEIDTNGNATTGTGPSSDKIARILYFSVASASDDGSLDPYNLYVEFDMGFGNTVPMTIDPDIKNDGTPP
ncbi:MAG TPA: nucleotide synthetase [Rhizomicrobium sp.]|jgi:hypothetical protein